MEIKSTDLQVGKKYKAFIEGGDFGDDAVFEDETFNFSVLPKPAKVEAINVDINGQDSEIIDLPDHLAQPNWYLIRKEGSNSTSWFSAEHVCVTEIDSLTKIELYREDNGQYSTSESKQDDISGSYYQSTDVDDLLKNLRERIKELEDNK